MSIDYNVANFLSEQAKLFPRKKAMILPSGESISFEILEQETQRMAALFLTKGIRRGMRVAMFIRPGFDFVPSIYALFRVGAIPVFIDPGMKLKNILACLREVEPEAMVGIPAAHILSRVFWRSFSSVKKRIVIGGSSARWIPGSIFCARVGETRTDDSCVVKSLYMDKDSPAAIIFTSGSTGVPKGVELTHGIFHGQAKILREEFQIGPDEVDLVVFPLFALFAASWGITAVIADMDPAKPSEVDGERLAEMIHFYNVTHTAGSPAIWKRLFEACADDGKKLKSLKRILMAGAPVPESILNKARKVLREDARVFTPYGATEALPLTSIGDRELRIECLPGTRSGKGTCVGRPLANVQLKIIAICDEAIEKWQDVRVLPDGQVGEVVVKGPLVTRSYFNRPESNRMTKIREGENEFWHRMGDLGYIDSRGRLWFCGRKDHRFQTENGEVYPVQVEGIFNQHPDVPRSAIVGVPSESGADEPVLIVHADEEIPALRKELGVLAEENGVGNISKILFKSQFPLDVRHNIKIDRPQLARYAREKMTELQ